MMDSRKETIIKCLEQIAKREKLIKFNIDVSSGFKNDGLTSKIFFSTVTSEFDEKLSLVVKQCVQNESLFKDMPFGDMFENEIFFYEEIYPELQRFQEKYGVFKPFLSVPKYYGNFIEGNKILIILENLRERGFVNYDIRNLLDKVNVTKVLQEYGNIHGIFFSYKIKHPEKFFNMKNKTKWSIHFSNNNKMIYDMFKTVFDEVVEYLEICDIKKEILDRLREYKNYPDLLEAPSKYAGKYECILHGDGWSNNMMARFSKNKEQKVLEEVYLLDWQLINVGTPVFDLAYFMYSSTPKEIFDRLEHFLRIYHNSLSQTLKAFGLDANEVYPFSALQSEWKIHAKAVLIIPFIIQKLRLIKRDDIVKAEDVKDKGDDHVTLTLKKGVTDCDKDLIFERIRNLLEHLFYADAL